MGGKDVIEDEVEGERAVKRLLKELGLPGGRVAVAGRGRWQREKAQISALVRKRTGVTNAWLAGRFSE